MISEKFLHITHFTSQNLENYKLMTISSTKTKSIAMWGNHIQKVKIVINNNIIEQVTNFKYLGYCISEFKSDVEDKFANL